MLTEIELFRCLDTNIGILIRDGETGEVAAIDAPDAEATLKVLEQKQWPLHHLLITHSHSDHIQGLDALRKARDFRVIAPEKSRELIQRADLWIDEGDVVRVGNLHFNVLATPGHSRDHVSYWLKENNIAFVGDVLFVMGCGRVFSGDYSGMWTSLQRLNLLPDTTQIYCGHDYAVKNAQFAHEVEPDNEIIKKRLDNILEKQVKKDIIMPTTLAEERDTNPFLRTNQKTVADSVNLDSAHSEAVFKALRDWKDRF